MAGLANPARIDDAARGAGLENHVPVLVLNLEEEAAPKNGRTAFAEASGMAIRNRLVHRNPLLPFAAFRARRVLLDARQPAQGGGDVRDIPVHLSDRFGERAGGG